MFAPFDEKLALEECRKMIDEIARGELTIRTIGQESEERANHGVMLGCLVCKTQDGRKVVLRTISGISRVLERAKCEKVSEDVNLCDSFSCEKFADCVKSKCEAGNSDENCAKYIYVEPIVSLQKIEEALAKNDKEIHELTDIIKQLKPLRKLKNGKYIDPNKEEKSLIDRRNSLCLSSQQKVFDLYSFCCADKKIRTLNEICTQISKESDPTPLAIKSTLSAQPAMSALDVKSTSLATTLSAKSTLATRSTKKLPPNGTGDCCAPKLLNYAFLNNLTVLSMCEIFYGQSTQNKTPLKSYPPCDERCAIILPAILGVNILYRDDYIIVVNKTSGLLSVPGRGIEKQDCIVNRIKRLFPSCIEQPSVHRLDMETSGLMVLAFTKEAHKNLNMQFEKRLVQKKYTALVDGVLQKKGFAISGQFKLYFRLDIENRPHQIWDEVYGKEAITEWEILGVQRYVTPDGTIKNVTRVLFTPHTGRTHQLRLASSDIHGFNTPIVGDTLYGTCQKGERLMLHSHYLSFTHPITNEKMEFNCKADF